MAPVMDLVEPLVIATGCSLVDVQFVNEGHGWILRIYIEKLSGATGLEECMVVNRHVSALLDVHEDLIPHAYRLEVSTPGAQRPLRKKEDFVRFAGQRAVVKMVAAWSDPDGVARKRFKGVLCGVEGEDVLMRVASQLPHQSVPVEHMVRIPVLQIGKASLDPVYPPV
ncbi:MAG: ribosome maturation factor RimP [Magnetococcales bacterium]|nr:ribosome maturation factor RimP [Magnetococcales bacterium]